MTRVTGPLVSPNLALVGVAGLEAHRRGGHRHTRGFLFGADALEHALLRLANYRTGVVMTPAFALEAAYSAMIGGLTLEPNAEIADRVSGWWFELVRLLATTDAAHKVDSEAMMASLLLVGVYEAEAARSYVSPAMRTKLLEALRVTQSMADDEERRLTALAWLPAGRAAMDAATASSRRRYRQPLRQMCTLSGGSLCWATMG